MTEAEQKFYYEGRPSRRLRRTNMQITTVFYCNALNDTVDLIGTWEYAKREQMAEAVDMFCKLNQYKTRNVKFVHAYLNMPVGCSGAAITSEMEDAVTPSNSGEL